MERLNSGGKKIIFRIILCFVIIGLTKSGRAAWQEEETRTYFSIVLIIQEQLCTSELSKVIQDAILLILHYRTMSLFRTISSKYIYHVGCAINLHSIINSGLKPGGQILSNKQTEFFLFVDPMDKNHKDPDKIDLEATRLGQHLHNAWKKHQNTENWFEINLALRKGLKFYQSRSNAIILYETLPAYCTQKVVRMETGAIKNEKAYALPRRPPKMYLKHDWMKDLGSEVARQPEGAVTRQAKSSQSNQPNPNPDHDRTGKPVVCPHRAASRELGSEVARQAEDNQPTQPNPNPIYRTERPAVTEQTSRSSAQEIDTRFLLTATTPNLFVEG